MCQVFREVYVEGSQRYKWKVGGNVCISQKGGEGRIGQGKFSGWDRVLIFGKDSREGVGLVGGDFNSNVELITDSVRLMRFFVVKSQLEDFYFRQKELGFKVLGIQLLFGVVQVGCGFRLKVEVDFGGVVVRGFYIFMVVIVLFYLFYRWLENGGLERKLFKYI